MGLMEAFSRCMSKYVTFSGRAPRAEYWYFVLANIIIQIVAGILDTVIGYEFGGGILYVIATLGLLLPALSALVRRLHDVDKSARWLLIYLVPLVGIIVLLVFTVRRGDEGSNRFGDNPYNTVSPEVFD